MKNKRHAHKGWKILGRMTAASALLLAGLAWTALRADPPAKPAAPTGTTPLSGPTTNHWAFRSPVLPKIPSVKNSRWVKTPIDAFILAKLEQKGISPPPNADRLTLLRRVFLDVIGLPPTPEEQQKFLNDTSPNAYEKVVDDLLARPQYGERWARHWLDTARYAETNGYERDGAKPNAWRYRDYVIHAFNEDKPYNRFLMEQIAGDEMEGSNAETQTATTFLRLGSWDDEPPEAQLDRYDQLDDVLGTTATALMGVTLRCARCHDHKFEPFTQKDYYRLLSVFTPLKRPQKGQAEFDQMVGTGAELTAYREGTEKADTEIALLHRQIDEKKQAVRDLLFRENRSSLPPDAIAAFRAEPAKRTAAQQESVKKHIETLEKEILAAASAEEKAQWEQKTRRIGEINLARPREPLRAYTWMEEGPNAPKICILGRGEPTRQGEEVTPGIPAIFAQQPLTPPVPMAKTAGRRLWLARWLTRPDNPLTARVMVNRLWQHHFGEGLVATANDFGVMGKRPTHPELLDWLAVNFTSHWSLKKLHRLILISNVYKAAATAQPDALKRDPENILLSRWRTRRLEAEAIRDSTLAVSGQLNLEAEGPSVYPPLPATVLQGQSRPGDGWGKSGEKQASRKSIYIFVKRSLAVPELETLDTPDTTSSCETRIVSTVAPQALTFLNGDFTRQQARYFAERLKRDAGAVSEAQVLRAFALAFCRSPRPAEQRAALDFLTAHQKQIESDAQAAGKPPGDARQKALEAFCLVLLNSNEFFYTD